MADNTITGAGGVVNGIAAIEDWALDVTQEVQEYFASSTDGAPGKVPGNDDWKGRFNALGFLPASLPGTALSFVGSIDGSVGASGPTLVASNRIAWDIKAGTLITHLTEFEANGALAKGAAVASDVTIPDPASSKGTKLDFGGTVQDNVQTMELVITSENMPYVDSGTDGDTFRKPGNLNLTASYVAGFSDYDQLPDEGDIVLAKMYCTATLFWEIKWLIVQEITNVVISPKTNEIVAATINLGFTGFSGGAKGYIKTPEAVPVTFWPP